MPPRGNPGQHFTTDYDLLAKINKKYQCNLDQLEYENTVFFLRHHSILAGLDLLQKICTPLKEKHQNLVHIEQNKAIISVAFGLLECEILDGCGKVP